MSSPNTQPVTQPPAHPVHSLLARLLRPRRVYLFSVAVGVAVLVLTYGQHPMFRILAASDAFFTCFVSYVLVYGVRLRADDLRRRLRGEKVAATMMLLTASGRVRRRKAWSQAESGAAIRCGTPTGR